ncbi:MAG: hypothetical protein KC543_04895 [Myxococcales bacterium]|nr:hypothetical protein [Myxococcales bacterium]
MTLPARFEAAGGASAPAPSAEGEGEVRSFDGRTLTFVSPAAYAPGAPVSMTVLVGGAPVGLEGRSLGSRRLPDGRFEARMRMVNLRRSTRETLIAALA